MEEADDERAVHARGGQKNIRFEPVNYAPDGTLHRSLRNDAGAPLPRGFLRRTIAEEKRRRLEESLSGLRGLLEEYTLSNVATPGDTLSVWTDARTWKTRRVQVHGFYRADILTLTATITTLPSGLDYMAYADANRPAKGLTVQVQTFDHIRPN